jgi:tetratricopeptide (TPR) repeat protein
MNRKKILLILGLFTLLLHLPAVFGPFFMWDDENLILGDPHIHSLSDAGYVFTPRYWKKDFQYANTRYRPLRTVTLMLDWKAWGTHAAGYHATNSFLDLAVVLLVFYFARLFLNSDLEALFAAALFAAHPVHVESVAWIKNRTDLLMVLFSLWFLLLFFKYKKENRLNPPNLAKLGLLYLLALFSKESAIALCFFLSLYLVLGAKEDLRTVFRQTLPFWLLSGAFLTFILFDIRADKPGGGLQLYESMCAAVQYMRLLFFPFALNADRPLITATDLAGPAAFAGLAGFFAYKKMRVETFLLLLAFLAVLSVSGAAFTTGRPIAEERLYLAVLPLALLAARFISSGRLRAACLLAVLLAFSGISLARAFDWENPVRFWEKAVRQSPLSANAHCNLGVAYERAGYPDTAVAREYRAAMELDPNVLEAYMDLGYIMYKTGKLDAAERIYRRLIMKSPALIDPRLMLAGILLERGQPAEARTLLKEAFDLEKQKPREGTGVPKLKQEYAGAGRTGK